MIDAISKGLNQKLPIIKLGPPARPSRAFGLWLALLVLYFLLLPTAANTPDRGAGNSANDGHRVHVVSSHGHYASVLLRR